MNYELPIYSSTEHVQITYIYCKRGKIDEIRMLRQSQTSCVRGIKHIKEIKPVI